MPQPVDLNGPTVPILDGPTVPVESGGAGRGELRVGLTPGEIVFGEYQIEGRIGAGGMGTVYRARHITLDEPRAIKVLKPDQPIDQLRMLIGEAKALKKVKHDAVVESHDLLSDEQGRRRALVMEFVEGTPLSDLLADGPLSTEDVLALARRLAAGLDAAHAEGVIHRDLSPDNVILPGGHPERAKLIDFGIAKDTHKAGTIFSGFKGKLRYASPEQLLADDDIGCASDAYSFGLVLAAAATGRDPQMGNTYDEALRARRNPPPLDPSIAPSLRHLIEPLLAYDPNDRPSPLAPHFATADSPGLLRRSAPAVAALAALLLLVALVIGVGGEDDAEERSAIHQTPISGTETTPIRGGDDEQPTIVAEVSPSTAPEKAPKTAPVSSPGKQITKPTTTGGGTAAARPPSIESRSRNTLRQLQRQAEQQLEEMAP